jgi:hypothetical protein
MTRAGAPAVSPPPTFTVAEALNLAQIRSELDHMTAGGIHPETLLAPVSRVLERASESTAGPHGGLQPSLRGLSAPGPAGEALAARGRVALARVQAFLRGA